MKRRHYLKAIPQREAKRTEGTLGTAAGKRKQGSVSESETQTSVVSQRARPSLSHVCPFLSGVHMPSTMLLTPPFSKSLHCQVCSCLSEQVPGVEYKPHPCLQSAGVKRNYYRSLLCWAWRNYPKAVFIMPLNLVPMFNVLSTLTPGVSLLRCSSPKPSYSPWLGGSSLTSVLLVFIHIKSWISDCIFTHLSKLTLVLLQPRFLLCRFLLSQESIVASGFPGAREE